VHALLDGPLAHLDAELEKLAADAFCAPRIVRRHHLYEVDGLLRQPRRLTLGSRLASPDELEEPPVPTQERAGLDNVGGLRPCRVEAGKQNHDYTITALDLRMSYGAAKHDELLAQQRVLCDKVRPRPHQVPDGVCRQRRHG
jgi:hypothetical protein